MRLLSLLFSVLLLLSCTQQPPTRTSDSTSAEPPRQPTREVTGKRAVGFELQGLDGGNYRLEDELGRRVILLDFWATYCEPCLVEMPQLQALSDNYNARGLSVVGISVDGPDSLAAVRAEVAKLGVTFPILLDSETRVLGLYNTKATAPFTVLIDRTGQIVDQHEGYAPGDIDQLREQIEAALQHR